MDKGTQLEKSADGNYPGGEIIVYRHFLSLGPEIALFILVSLAALYYTAKHPEFIQYVDIGVVILPIPLFLLLPVVLASYIIHGLYNYKYVISNDYVLDYEGVLSFKMTETRVEYEHIRGIEVDRTIYQRILGLGDIRIGTAVRNDVEVLLKGIYNPHYYKDIIESRLRRHVEAMEISGLKRTLQEELDGKNITDK